MVHPAAQMKAQELALVHVWFQRTGLFRTAGPVEGLTDQMQRGWSVSIPTYLSPASTACATCSRKILVTQRVEVALLGAMAALALLLSAVGISPSLPTWVGPADAEIGIRMALGSTVGRQWCRSAASGAGASVLGLFLGLALCAGSTASDAQRALCVGVYDVPTLSTVVLTLVL